jgi:hypothetical protein
MTGCGQTVSRRHATRAEPLFSAQYLSGRFDDCYLPQKYWTGPGPFTVKLCDSQVIVAGMNDRETELRLELIAPAIRKQRCYRAVHSHDLDGSEFPSSMDFDRSFDTFRVDRQVRTHHVVVE